MSTFSWLFHREIQALSITPKVLGLLHEYRQTTIVSKVRTNQARKPESHLQ